MDQNNDTTGIVFFDVETTVPTPPGQGYALLEFGAILVCPRMLEELDSFSTLVKPSNLSLINSLYPRSNGITHDAVISAPSFSDISDRVYDFLRGRIWAGHNIVEFDCVRIREAFAEIGKPMPESKGMIDTYVLLTQKFGRRAGNMKMASLATYFNLGEQTHRSLDDVRMNLEVVKHCATVLFLESSLPESPEFAYTAQGSGSGRYNAGYLEPEEISIPSISVSLGLYYRGIQKMMKISHKDVGLQISCTGMRVRFGVKAKFVDRAGRPKLNFVVDAPSSLCGVLDACDEIARRLSVDSGSCSDWKPVVIGEGGIFNSSTVRLHIPTTVGDNVVYDTEMYQKEPSGTLQKLVFVRVDASELDALFVPGTHIDAYFSLDPYDYQQNAGIRLVAKKLIMHSA